MKDSKWSKKETAKQKKSKKEHGGATPGEWITEGIQKEPPAKTKATERNDHTIT